VIGSRRLPYLVTAKVPGGSGMAGGIGSVACWLRRCPDPRPWPASPRPPRCCAARRPPSPWRRRPNDEGGRPRWARADRPDRRGGGHPGRQAEPLLAAADPDGPVRRLDGVRPAGPVRDAVDRGLGHHESPLRTREAVDSVRSHAAALAALAGATQPWLP